MSHQLLPDRELCEHGEAVSQALARYASKMRPQDLRSLVDPAVEVVFTDAMRSIDADSGAIWLVDRDRTRINVGFSHPDRSLEGSELPLGEGFVSLVLASENPICENGLYASDQHSKRIDEQLGRTTDAMVAVPFYVGGIVRGVVSCVQWLKEDGTPSPGFSAEQLSRVQRLSAALERLANYHLLKIILEFEA